MAGESSTDHVHSFEVVSADRLHVIEPLSVGPVLRQHGSAIGIFLDLPDDRPQAGAFQPQLQAADAGEQRTDRQRAHV